MAQRVSLVEHARGPRSRPVTAARWWPRRCAGRRWRWRGVGGGQGGPRRWRASSGGAPVVIEHRPDRRDTRCPTSAAWRRRERCWRRRARCRPTSARCLLLSGGASALVGAPVDGVSLEELRAATSALLDGGASIREINVVRRHLTRARRRQAGGGVRRAPMDVLALSDVAGDDPATIGSGPASPEPATRAEAMAVARRYALPERGASGARARRREPARRRRGVRARDLSRAGVAGDAARCGGARDGAGGVARDRAPAARRRGYRGGGGGPRARGARGSSAARRSWRSASRRCACAARRAWAGARSTWRWRWSRRSRRRA